MTDVELLELAAKSTGIAVQWDCPDALAALKQEAHQIERDRIAAYVETLSVADGAGGLHLRVTTAGSIEGRLFADAIRGMK